jgi:hypothetical protein
MSPRTHAPHLSACRQPEVERHRQTRVDRWPVCMCGGSAVRAEPLKHYSTLEMSTWSLIYWILGDTGEGTPRPATVQAAFARESI